MHAIENRFRKLLDERQQMGLKRTLKCVDLLVGNRLKVEDHTYHNFASNDYLGLSRHPLLIKRARDWAKTYGVGQPSSRLVTGNGALFAPIETKLAAFKGKEAALIMASGYQANVSVLAAMLDKRALGATPLVYADRLNHASMHMGCAAAGVRQRRYHHCDINHLAQLLDRDSGKKGPKFILSESVFSMDGDVAPMDDLVTLAKKYEAYLIIDDAHATGILGEGGRGLSVSADLVIGTFSKAMGSFGAYVAGSQLAIDFLTQQCGGLIYSTALPPMNLGAIDASLDLVGDLDQERKKVADWAEQLRDRFRRASIDTGNSSTQIIPLIVGKSEPCLQLAKDLADDGIWLVSIRPPTVPKGTARLRLTLSAAHTQDQIDLLSEKVCARWLG